MNPNQTIRLEECKTKLWFGQISVQLPLPVVQIKQIKDRILIRMSDASEEARGRRSTDRAERDRYIEITNRGIWCFELTGKLLWKVPEYYSEKAHQSELEEHGHRIFGYFVDFSYNAETDTIKATTSYGNWIRVQLSDGSEVERGVGR